MSKEQLLTYVGYGVMVLGFALWLFGLSYGISVQLEPKDEQNTEYQIRYN